LEYLYVYPWKGDYRRRKLSYGSRPFVVFTGINFRANIHDSEEEVMHAIILSLLCSLMLAIGQICWKLALAGQTLSWNLSQIFALVFKPLFIAGVLLYCIATIFWIYLLSKYELSYIYPMIAFAYVFGAVLSIVVLKEHVSLIRMSGIMFVVVGVAIIGLNK